MELFRDIRCYSLEILPLGLKRFLQSSVGGLGLILGYFCNLVNTFCPLVNLFLNPTLTFRFLSNESPKVSLAGSDAVFGVSTGGTEVGWMHHKNAFVQFGEVSLFWSKFKKSLHVTFQPCE